MEPANPQYVFELRLYHVNYDKMDTRRHLQAT